MHPSNILIADSGSTKTAWRLLTPEGTIKQFNTAGINPFLQQEEGVFSTLHAMKQEVTAEELTLFFYGAGCKGEKADEMQKMIQHVFPHAHIHVASDLLAAARATCHRLAGIVGILGTGANSCQFDGEHIVDQIPSLGYVMGDEGSGAVMGKNLVSAFFKRELPDHLAKKFDKRYSLKEDVLLARIYQQDFPNRYLASFTRFLHHNLEDPWIFQFVYEQLTTFFERNAKKYNGYGQMPIHFVGSIAFYFSNVLRKVAEDNGTQLGRVLETPIAGLTLFHKDQAMWV